MSANEIIRTVTALWRFPVKSMGGEQPDEVEFSSHGIVGDRAFALIDKETGRVISAKSVKLFPNLLSCRAAFVEPPRLGLDLPPVRIALPDGQTVTSDADDVDRVVSAFFRREVTLARSAPPDFTIDMYHPDIEGAAPGGDRGKVVPQKLGSAYFEEAGQPSPVPVGSFFDLFPASLITTSTFARLAELQPGSRFDSRRFRMNVIVGTNETGFPENDWIGRSVSLGGAVRLRVEALDSRCVMTTLGQNDLPNDPDILRTLARHNRVPAGAAGASPCAGVYAVIKAPGTVRKGDSVVVD